MSFVKGLQCRECGQDYPQEPLHVCETCFGPLEIVYDYDAIANSISPNTIASSIAIGNPADGYDVVHAVKESGGWGESVTDEEIIEGIKLLARTEGIFTEPAGGTEVAVTRKLIQKGRIPHDESIVISITGNGYKTLEAIAGTIEQPYTIKPRWKSISSINI